MEEKYAELINQYDIVINSFYRSRGYLYLVTPLGLFQLRNYDGSETRQCFEASIKEHLRSSGYTFLDYSVQNRNGKYISLNQYNEKFLLRRWYECEECSLVNEDHIKTAAANLARLHFHMTGFSYNELQAGAYQQTSVDVVFDKRTRELKRVKGYIRSRKKRNMFENTFLSVCNEYISYAEEAEELFLSMDYKTLYQTAKAKGNICHGNYTHHNILILPNGKAAVSGFDKAEFGLQLIDLYLLIRKVMEKNSWDINLGVQILDTYSNINQLTRLDTELLYILLLYPEKFWKITNSYFNNKKSWVPRKNLQKLSDMCLMSEQKKVFLERMRYLL